MLLGPATDGPGTGSAADLVEQVFQDALALRELLEFEFFFPAKSRFREELADELERLDPHWSDRVGSGAEVLARTDVLVAPRVLRSFVDAQLVVGRVLAERPGPDRDAVLQTCLGTGEQMLLQGTLHRPDSVSRELYASALKLAEHRGITAGGGDGELAGEARLRFLVEVRDVLDRLDRLGALEQELVDGALQ